MRVFHLLPEADFFSEANGGAISRWVANVAKPDATNLVVACEADSSWGIPAERILILPRLKRYRLVRKFSGSRRVWSIRKLLIRTFCAPLLKTVRPGDLVWVHNRPETAAALAPLLIRKGVKVVLHMHNSHLRYTTPLMRKELQKVQLVFVSNYLKTEAEGISSTYVNGIVLYNGADAKLFRPVAKQDSANSLRVLFVGRLVPDKGAHILVAALKRLAARNLPVTGIIVGAPEFRTGRDSPYVRGLKEDAAPNTEFRGHLSGQPLIQEFQQADLFCVPSVWNDPFPLAPLEAMASGLPVIAARSGGVPEALRYGGGVIVERGSVEELEQAIEAFLNDPDLRRQNAARAVDAFEKHFTWSIVRREFTAIVDTVIGKDRVVTQDLTIQD